ncbi:MAG: PolC-type DNA polymerase III [Clostridia bacterium]|nr:PolC-type DNA polymerase III [Clostridia bacterium]
MGKNIGDKKRNGAILKWEHLIETVSLQEEYKNILLTCEIKKILVSQADKAWEIYFQVPSEPSSEIKEAIDKIWKDFFGEKYKTSFYFECIKTYDDLNTLCKECWDDFIKKLTKKIPSCRGWLQGVSFCVKDDKLHLIVKQKGGADYLSSRGINAVLEKILKNDYKMETKVVIECGDLEESNGNELKQLEDLENEYKEKFYKLNTMSVKSASCKNENNNYSRIILGKAIKNEHIPIESIIEEEKSVTVKGYIFNLEIKDLRSGRSLVSFIITNKVNSIACKIIRNPKDQGLNLEGLKDGNWYLISGSVQHDRYTQELTIFPANIMEINSQVREDNCERKRVELHLHTKMSALDAVADVKDVVKTAIAWGHPAVAITDHGVVQAFPDAYNIAKGNDIRIIYGLEGYLFDDSIEYSSKKIPTYHVIILVKSQEGLKNLYSLVTISHLQYYHRVPRIPKSELIKLREGLLIGTACEAGELFRGILNKFSEEKLEEIASLYDYLEIQPLGNNQFLINNGTVNSQEDLIKINKYIYKLGKKLNKPVVATCDSHFLEPEDEVYRRILMTGKGFDDADNQPPLYFRTTEEMLNEFTYLGEEEAEEVVIDNPLYIASLVNEIKPIPDELYPPNIPGAEEDIINLTKKRACELYGKNLPEIVQKRIDKELNSIINNGFAVLYWIAHKLVKKSNEDGYLVGSRGSVGSSLVAHFCGITEVNALEPHYRCPSCKYTEFVLDGSKECGADLDDSTCPNCGTQLCKEGHNIPFEVFLGFKGDKVPDIDLNFSGEYQSKAQKNTEELFGKDNVFRAGTIATVANKTAYGFVKNYFEDKKQYVSQAEMSRLIEGCTGVKRTTGQHPGGVMVLPKGLDIHLFTPLQRPANDVKSDIITTHFDYHSISSRLVKLDNLGHDDPTIIKMLEDLTGVDSRTIPLDEKGVLSLFTGLDALGIKAKDLGTDIGTLGIPEFGTKFVRQMLEDTKPKTFSELVRISGFSHGTDVWLNNAQDLITSGTAKTSEVISARDDIMTYLMYKGLEPIIAFKIMEDVRKGKGVKPEYEEAMKEKDVPDWYVESCKKIKYMFPKAHAVAYVMMAFRIAYFKIYYPAAYYASYFTVRGDEFDADIAVSGIDEIKGNMEQILKKGKEATQKEGNLYTILELTLEMYLRKIRLERVNLLSSDAEKFLIVDNNTALLPPFNSLQGLGKTAALGIVKARKEKPFISKDDLRIRGKVGKAVIEVLDKHGALEGLPENDQMTLF